MHKNFVVILVRDGKYTVTSFYRKDDALDFISMKEAEGYFTKLEVVE